MDTARHDTAGRDSARRDTESHETAHPDKARRFPRWWLYVILTIGLLAVITPFVWMVLGSFKSEGELRQSPPTWWPQTASLDNYTQLFSRLNFGTYFFNSTVVAVTVTIG